MDAAAGSISKGTEKASPQTVIIVDDQEYMRELHLDFCKEIFPGAKLVQFNNGLDAWDALQCGVVAVSQGDILITDCNMPKMSGLDLAKNIKTAGIPVMVAMFSGEKRMNRFVAGAAGVSVYQEKPEMMQLYATLISSRAIQ